MDKNFCRQADYSPRNESPMGGGKGAVDHFVSVVKKGRILFEMDGVTQAQAQEAMRLAYKLPVKSKFLVKEKHGNK